MEFPKNFPPISEPLLPSYDWFDFGTNTGYKRFYCAGTEEGVFLTTQTFVSGSYSGIAEPTVDTDFDITFKTALDIKGKVIISFPAVLHNNEVGTETIAGALTLRIRKYSGTTETEVANTTFNYSQSLGTGAYSYEQRAFSIEVPQTHYAAGDVLRFTVGIANVTLGRILYYYSTEDLTVTGLRSSQLTLDIPFNVKQ